MAQELEIPARRVEIDVRPGVAEVAVVVRRRAADVHLDDAGSERCKRSLLPGAGVVQSKDHEVANAATGAALLSPLPAESKRFAPVTRTHASKPISCAGICHRPAGAIDQRKIAAFARRKPWVQIPLGPLPPAALSTGVQTTNRKAPSVGILGCHKSDGKAVCVRDGCCPASKIRSRRSLSQSRRSSREGLLRGHPARDT